MTNTILISTQTQRLPVLSTSKLLDNLNTSGRLAFIGVPIFDKEISITEHSDGNFDKKNYRLYLICKMGIIDLERPWVMTRDGSREFKILEFVDLLVEARSENSTNERVPF